MPSQGIWTWVAALTQATPYISPLAYFDYFTVLPNLISFLHLLVCVDHTCFIFPSYLFAFLCLLAFPWTYAYGRLFIWLELATSAQQLCAEISTNFSIIELKYIILQNMNTAWNMFRKVPYCTWKHCATKTFSKRESEKNTVSR